MPVPGPTIVVAGAGLAGLRACEGLRSRGFGGSIVLCGDEAHPPYDRPPLSKQFLSGTWGLEKVWLRSPERLAELDLDLRLGEHGQLRHLDAAARTIELEGGEQIAYDGLVVATGSRARLLPGVSELDGAHVLRTLDDATAIAAVARRPSARLLLVGAGFIGLEVAATARRLGAEVTVVEPLEVPLGRVLGEVVGRVCEEMHRAEGVRFELGASLASAETTSGSIVCTTTRGARIEADGLLVGIGAVPSTGWLEDSGLDAGPSGLVCDAALVAGPRVVAAGDVARWTPFGEPSVRIEHRTNAAEQGDHAAASLLALLAKETPQPFATVPYVWSDQYDVKIQVLGLPEPTDEVTVVDGSTAEGGFVALYGREGRLSGVVGFRRPRALMKFRSLVERRAPYPEAVAHQIA